MHSRRRLFFLPLLFSVIAIISPSVLSLIFLAKFSIAQSISLAEASNEHLLFQIRDQIESVFSEIEMMSLSFILNPQVNSIFRLSDDDEGVDYYTVYEIQNSLPRYKLSNKYISGVDIVYRKNDLVLSPSGSIIDSYGFLSQKLFPDSNFVSIEDSLWKRSFHNQILVTGGGIWYLSSFPLEALHPQGLIVIEMNKSEIYKLLSFFDISSEGRIDIIEKGNVILSYPENAHTYEDKDMIVNRVDSKNGQWEVVSKVPIVHVLSTVKKLQIIQSAVTLGSIFVTIILGFLLLKWNSLPIIRLLGKLASEDESSVTYGIHGYKIINSGVDSIIEKSDALKKQLLQQESLLKSSYIGNLIRGDFGDAGESLELAEIVGLSNGLLPAAVFIIRRKGGSGRGLDSYSNKNRIGAETAKFVSEKLGQEILSYPLEGGDLLFLLPRMNLSSPVGFLKDRLMPHLNNQGSGAISIYYGGICIDAEGIHNAFSRAELLTMTIPENQEGFFASEKNNQGISTFIYPIEWEVKLLTFIKAGNCERVEELLCQVEQVNFQDKKLSLYSLKQLINQLNGTLHRCDKNSHYSVDESKDLTGTFYQIKKDLLSNAEANVQQRDQGEALLKKRMYSCVLENYSDSGFTIYHLAEKTGLVETIVYNTFKRLFGTTFAAYLESLRISRSTEFLEQGEKINDVAFLSGFGNSQTFRRVFKRRMGVTPSTFVKSI